MREFARSQTAFLLRRFAYQAGRVSRDCGADAIHDLRVSIRRLNRCLRTFADFYPRRSWKPVRRKLHALMEAAGAVRDDDGTYWEVRSKTGWISARHDQVRLRGQVVASNQDKAAQPAVMRTEQLNVFPQKHLATSKVGVTLTQPGSTMRGVGMRADLHDKRIKLLSQVRGTYDPKH